MAMTATSADPSKYSFHERDDDMASTMTTSTMTDRQIERAVEIFRAQLRKHAAELPSDAVQQVFGQSEIGPEWLAVLRTRVEAVSKLITRRARVNRNRNAQAALDATGRRQYTDKDVVDAMPQGEGEEAEIVFFNLGRYVNNADLDKEYEVRGLKPVDPYSLAAVNENDPAFADQKPNATHWKDSNDKWCYTAFDRWNDGRIVGVNRNDDDWSGDWWFAGVRK